MTRRELRENAQDALMGGMQAALESLAFDGEVDIYNAALVQFRRIEKFFGYEPGSYSAGV